MARPRDELLSWMPPVRSKDANVKRSFLETSHRFGNIGSRTCRAIQEEAITTMAMVSMPMAIRTTKTSTARLIMTLMTTVTATMIEGMSISAESARRIVGD